MILDLDTSAFEGAESSNFYEFFRVGTIISIDYNTPQQGGAGRRQTYGTGTIQWMDTRLGILDQVPLAYPISGQGWGIYTMPRAGDIMVAGFRSGGYPVIFAYLQGNPYYELGSLVPIAQGEAITGKRYPPQATGGGEVLYRPTRYLTGGELFFKSFQGAELYMDRFANMRFIVRLPRNDNEINNPNKLTLADVTENAGIWDITLGTARQNDLFLISPNEVDSKRGIEKKDVKKISFNGKEVNFDASHMSGFNTQVDTEGSLSVNCPKDVATNAAGEEVHMATKGYTMVVNGANGTVTISLNEDGSITMSDGFGSTVTLDGAGAISLTSPNGTSVDVEDNNIQLTTSGGTGVVVDDVTMQVSVTAQNVVVNSGNIALGQAASHPLTVSDLMAVAFNNLVLAFNTHTHIYSPGPGGPTPTPPPVVPAIPVTPVQISSTVAISE